ncbi:putative integral membrane protein [Candida albicans]|uniref:ditrans,polycis-polyprenyl diphosphate synthase [(2E,6E)-farnesyldiphosphate specific] n=1 Tax=Candida albicans TaxID=5476 RepID=A0A8H6C5U5_CANAX|nr:putative integral membrane protein [Candida albicans]
MNVTSPKISENVRLRNNGNTQLKNITCDMNNNDNESNEDSETKAPPNSYRIYNIFSIILALFRSLIKTTSKTTNSVFQMSMFYINHFILLSLFFMIAIYKNFQYLYRRVYLKYLAVTYYPSKSPQVIREDINKLEKIPKIVSCILDLQDDEDENGGKDGLINSISELTAWSMSAGLTKLIIYEFTGYITKTLVLYFGTEAIPTFSIRIPHKNLIIYSDNHIDGNAADLEIDLISRIDGKPTLVELTKTMSELAVNRELSIRDITIDLIDEELHELVGPEPDLLISFAPSLNLEDIHHGILD